MTDKPTPTDEELNTILCAHWPAFAAQSTLVKIWVRDAVQDAIDKWGQPAHAVEPVSQPPKNAIRQAFDAGAEYSANEWRGRVETAQLELEVYRKAYQTLLEQVAKGVSIMRPPPLVISAPQPVAREPLSDEQIEALPMWKRFVGLWPETRREIVRIIEAQHGIKGGQHVE